MITREEAKKASKFVDKYLTNSDLPYNKEFSNALHTTQLFINQPPQLSNDIEEVLEEVGKLELRYKTNDVYDLVESSYQFDKLKQHIQALENRNKELEELPTAKLYFELANKYELEKSINKDYENILNEIEKELLYMLERKYNGELLHFGLENIKSILDKRK